MPKKTLSIPQDEQAERSLIGCLAHGADIPDLDPDWWFHDGRALIVDVLVNLKCQDWTTPQTNHPADRVNAARINLEKTAYIIEKGSLWTISGSIQYELQLCLDSVSGPEHADYFSERLRVAKARRDAIAVHQKRLTAAYTGEIETALQGTELSASLESVDAHKDVRPRLLRLSDVQSEDISWLWPGRIPAGKLTLIAGDPGLGKSLLTADLTARTTAMATWPDGESNSRCGGVVMLSAEDDPADTIRPRMDAAGADPQRVVLLQGVTRYDSKKKEPIERPISLQRDLDAIRSAIEVIQDCRLVIIDPINAYIGDVDSHKDTELRTVLTPLCELARDTGVALIAVSHLNKSSNSPAIYRTMGSVGFVAAARVVWLVTKDPDDPTGRRRLMLPAKANLGPDSGGLAFEVKTSASDQPILSWEEGTVQQSADEIFATPRNKPMHKPSSAISEAVEWLRVRLADGPQPASEMLERAKSDGITEATLRRAKSQLAIKVGREGYGKDGQWLWMLPGAESACH